MRICRTVSYVSRLLPNAFLYVRWLSHSTPPKVLYILPWKLHMVVRVIWYLAFRLLSEPRGEPINCLTLECWSVMPEDTLSNLSGGYYSYIENFWEQTSLDGFSIYQDNWLICLNYSFHSHMFDNILYIYIPC